MDAVSNFHEALQKSILWIETALGRNGSAANYWLLFGSKADRSRAQLALDNVFPGSDYSIENAPTKINNRPYYRIKIESELGEKLTQSFPETHRVGPLRPSGGCQTEESPYDKATIEKVKAAFSVDNHVDSARIC